MKKEKLITILLPVLLFILFALGYFKSISNESDSIKFKNEYEKLNKEYYSVKLSENNPIKYSSYDEIYETLKKGTGIVFFGYPEDNNSRFSIEILLDVIKSKKIKTTIYYLDIHEDIDSYTIEDNLLVYQKDDSGNEIKGTKNYFKLLDILKENLSDYILYLDETKYEVGEKRMYLPAFIFVRKGDILDIVYSDSTMDPSELSSIYESYLLDIYSNTCEVNQEEPC